MMTNIDFFIAYPKRLMIICFQIPVKYIITSSVHKIHSINSYFWPTGYYTIHKIKINSDLLIMSSDLCRIHSSHSDLFCSSEARTWSTDQILRVKKIVLEEWMEKDFPYTLHSYISHWQLLLIDTIPNTQKVHTQKPFLQTVMGSVIRIPGG